MNTPLKIPKPQPMQVPSTTPGMVIALIGIILTGWFITELRYVVVGTWYWWLSILNVWLGGYSTLTGLQLFYSAMEMKPKIVQLNVLSHELTDHINKALDQIKKDGE